MRHRGPNIPFDPERKVRTREHVIADLSYNYLERKVLGRGHWLDAPRNDYGIDATMFHHNERGEIENGEVRFQLKATDAAKPSREGNWIPLRVDAKDLRYWCLEVFPVIIVLYEASKDRAWWLHIQDYLDRNPKIMASDADKTTLRIPTSNKLTARSIDRFRELSLESVAQFTEYFRKRP